MSAAELLSAAQYLAPIHPPYWKWDERHEAIGWEEGPTITLRQELAIVLAAEQPRGLPPFNAILLLLAACRDSWRESHQSLMQIITDISAQQRYMPMWIADVLSALESIHQISKTQLATPRRKAELVAYLFEDQPQRATTADEASSVVKLLSTKGPIDWPENLQPVEFDLWKTIAVLRDALKKFDAEAFVSWCKTGLSQQLVAANVELTAGERVRSLLAELNDHEELGGLMRLAKQLLAAITLPRPLAEPDDLPLGGVSDITNRGQLDRLLLSELAHDDLTLAVRVATGEALYFRRETPPRSPPLRRAILLDSGLRVWGVPRVFISAVGLALAAAGDEQLEINAFRACGDQLLPVDLTRQSGVEQHLEALEIDLHPGAACRTLQTKCADQECPSDAVIITTDDSLADEDFRRQLRAAHLSDTWIVAVNREGHVRLLELGQRDMVLKREARIDLAAALAPPAKKPVAPLVVKNPELPAFCSHQPAIFPLRLPHHLTVDRMWSIGDRGALSFSKDGRLSWWTATSLGPQILTQNFPQGRVLWADTVSSHEPFRAVVGKLAPRGMYAVQVYPDSGHIRRVQLKHEHSVQFTSVTATAEHIFLIARHRVIAFNWTGDEVAGTRIDSSLQYHRDRYFFHPHQNSIAVIACDGHKIIWQAVMPDKPVGRLLAIVGPPDAAHGLREDGRLIDLLSWKVTNIIQASHEITPFQVAAISRCGERVAIRNSQGRLFVYHHRTKACVPAYLEPEAAVEPKLAEFIGANITLRHKFRGIGVNGQGQLAIVSNNGQELSIEVEPKLLLRDRGRTRLEPPQFRPFQEMATHLDYDLSITEWGDGSRAWLDSRGLLHLKSSDAIVPEITIVLHVGHTAGWQGWLSGNHYTGGNPYFIYDGENPNVTTAFANALRRFTGRLST
ncbi:hypothetical protein NA78x_001422 [Anatilimnocola sp. NA78]|uniref:hypothetical protein n=1 Tax=Anatilimnocola sp. NA78 TaxID=3415683 RepID=UPI003CE4C655